MKILLVEDSRTVTQLMTARLSSYGHEVVHAENGKVAIEKFEATSPDLVLMDIEMPVMNGFQSTNEIRELETQKQWAWTPIIFLTSSDTVNNLVTAIESGGDDFMSKYTPEPVLNAKMKAMGRIASLRHKLSIANEKLQSLADHDGLTGLLNRRSLDLKVSQFWLDAIANVNAFSVLMIDIDYFKKYNDQYGHQAGDHCLQNVAKALESAVSNGNSSGITKCAFVARYGGEEFAVVIPGAPKEAVIQLSQSIIDVVRNLLIPNEASVEGAKVTISIGGAHVERALGDVENVFRLADSHLYQAKKDGRNRMVVT
ncbi:GGDEF domain-containing response regulator [Undibacterium sp. RuRC25W]|uniref:GGDEF domain-containing response regulator n=1 Tax=Undibacterium sp. RuRC25W TaxID=3413047 RepID=UPI003BF0011D